ncbi:hypothetical protein M378DRAFT_178463 [Amanita muscaria Koide BX008]|uniref:F-box domain-containing protein n=1 Tax=Amanita muscaria (strain Koide BX008) TaxID=946122 RepID=A0A0C2X985_AMAMK|nr:hypothetical protein M378DRAFT_178463 [Amanita muscaria Koide BX008]
MDASVNTEKDAHPYLLELPMELHLRIRNDVRRDLDTSIEKQRQLRLVCKTLDTVWSPIVNANLVLSPGGPDTVAQFRYLVEGKGKAYLSPYTTLTIKGVRSARTSDIAQAKDHVTSLPDKLDLPNVLCGRLLYDHKDNNWSIDLCTKILLSLEQLTELELSICEATDVQLLVRRLEPLTGLQKLTLLPSKATPSQVRSIASFIARNKNLTHLIYDWKTTQPFDLTELFREVPPLKLEHLTLNSSCKTFNAVATHTKSLASFEFRASERNTWCTAFTRAKIFPPTLTVNALDSAFVTYVAAHPRIVHLTATSGSVSLDALPDSIHYPSLFKRLVQHCEWLKYLLVNTEVLPIMLHTPEERMGFVRCVINLDEIILMNDKTLDEYPNPEAIIQDVRLVLSLYVDNY